MRISDWSSDVCSSDLTVREAAKRTLGQRHYDTQLIGGMVLHDGKIAEMKTGEGKTLVATLACYLHALPGDRKSVVKGKSVSVRVDLGGRRIIQKKKKICKDLNTRHIYNKNQSE